MAFELQSNNFTNGQGYVVMPLIATLMLFSSLTAPVDIADMRAELEAAQPQPFEDDDWNIVVEQLAAVQLVDSSLTSAERSVYNTLRAAASPPPSTRCCGSVVPANGDGFTNAALYLRAGTGVTSNYQVQVEFQADKSYTCDIATIEVVLGVIGAAPNPIPATPVQVDFVKCNDSGKAIYSYYWIEFDYLGATPVGESYNLEVTYKDASGAVLSTYALAYNTPIS